MFKIGDRLKPKKGKTQSNYWKLHNIKEVKFLNQGTYFITVRIIKGDTYNYNHYRRKGEHIDVHPSFFELINKEQYIDTLSIF